MNYTPKKNSKKSQIARRGSKKWKFPSGTYIGHLAQDLKKELERRVKSVHFGNVDQGGSNLLCRKVCCVPF